jgi:single-stranded-DNA-specific exonuclease
MTTSREWLPKPSRQVSEEIQNAFRNGWVQQRLMEMNLFDAKSANAFIDPTLYIPTDPTQLPDLEKGAQRIKKAIQNHEAIGIWGDFDVDGQTSTTLLVQALRKLGADPRYHIPNRDKESHGIRLPYLQEFVTDPIHLLITCDTGVSEHESVDYANSLGIDVIITDHHSLSETLPNAFAVINPQRLEDGHPLKTLAGVGTAYKLVERLLQLFDRENEKEELLDLVALGTIADVAVLNPENHFLVQRGIKKIRENSRLLLKEILIKKEVDPEFLNETHISFYIAPLLNALGRLDDAQPIIEHFLSNDLQKTRVYANTLDNLNEKRKWITEQITDAAVSLIERDQTIQDLDTIVLHHPDWHPGVLGIVASRLVETYLKPTILLTGQPGQGIRGSGRSVEGINIIQAIRELASVLSHYGGHAMAAGLSLKYENLDTFKREFNRAVHQQFIQKDIPRHLMIEGYLELDKVSLDFVHELEVLAPFGPGNPPFIFASNNVNINKTSVFGKGKKHLRFSTIDENNISLDLLWWQGANKAIPDSVVDIVFQLGRSVYKGKEQLQIEVIDLRPAESTREELRTSGQKLEVLDFRSKDYDLEKLAKEYDDLVVWAEGLSDSANNLHRSRVQLRPAKTLVVHTCPPNLQEMAKAWRIVNPQIMILGNHLPEKDSINALIQMVIGMLKFTEKHNGGAFDLYRAAAASGQGSKTIRAVLGYLSAKGEILIKEHPDAGISISFGGSKDPSKVKQYENHLRFLLQEAIYFRKWYQTTPSSVLMNEIFDLFSVSKGR